MEEFQNDFEKEIRPFVEANYRAKTDREHRAIAGLSMGGAQTLNLAFNNLSDFAHIGVFSSGIFGITGGFGGQPPSTEWEDGHKQVLQDSAAKEGLRDVWFSTGKDDFLVGTSRKTVEMLKSYDFEVTYVETDGGHTWLNWRDYLAEFAPKLFQ